MSARDELTDALVAIRFPHGSGLTLLALDGTSAEAIADAVLRSGYRKPRTIAHSEDLIGLPNGSLIMSTGRHPQFAGVVYRVKSAGMVERVGKELDGVTPFRYFVDPLPATVIHEPAATR